ncbi:hypothetical protein LINPERPRIM_LOCUS8164 [Linum perenne]
MGRTGKTEEAAGLVAFLCLPGLTYVTGRTVAVNCFCLSGSFCVVLLFLKLHSLSWPSG